MYIYMYVYVYGEIISGP